MNEVAPGRKRWPAEAVGTAVGLPSSHQRNRRLRSVKRFTLARQIADRIASAIRSGGIEPGTRLVETQLATEMATSRGPVREALRQLTDAGLIEIIPHRGTFVIHPSHSELADMVVMRAILEGLAARLLITRQEPAAFQNLERIVQAMKAAAGTADVAKLRELDWKFHEAICKASGSPLLYKTWRQMRDGIALIISAENPIYKDAKYIISHHASLVEKLKRSSPAQAEQLFRQNTLRSGFQWLKEPIPSAILDGSPD